MGSIRSNLLTLVMVAVLLSLAVQELHSLKISANTIEEWERHDLNLFRNLHRNVILRKDLFDAARKEAKRLASLNRLEPPSMSLLGNGKSYFGFSWRYTRLDGEFQRRGSAISYNNFLRNSRNKLVRNLPLLRDVIDPRIIVDGVIGVGSGVVFSSKGQVYVVRLFATMQPSEFKMLNATTSTQKPISTTMTMPMSTTTERVETTMETAPNVDEMTATMSDEMTTAPVQFLAEMPDETTKAANVSKTKKIMSKTTTTTTATLTKLTSNSTTISATTVSTNTTTKMSTMMKSSKASVTSNSRKLTKTTSSKMEKVVTTTTSTPKQETKKMEETTTTKKTAAVSKASATKTTKVMKETASTKMATTASSSSSKGPKKVTMVTKVAVNKLMSTKVAVSNNKTQTR